MQNRYSGKFAVLAGVLMTVPMVANAGLFDNMTFTGGGFVRLEAAIKTSDQENPNNQRGNPYNDIAVGQQFYVPPNTVQNLTGGVVNVIPILGGPLNSIIQGLPITGLQAAAAGNWTTPVPGHFRAARTRPVPDANNLFNYHILRAEGAFGWGITDNLKLRGRLRVIGELGHYSDFNAGDFSDPNSGIITGGYRGEYGGAPNYFQYFTEGGHHELPLEWDGPNYQAYFPSLFLEYVNGPVNVRLGEQQIAWGKAIFFRVFDTANGLDLRRHSLLDYAQEEFADKRVPAPALRVTWQATSNILVDGYVEKFQPTIYPNANTPYNVIPAQFTVHDYYNEYNDKLNYAIRAQMNLGQWFFEAFAGRRYNPAGAFAWQASGVDSKPFPGINDGQIAELTANAGNTGPTGVTGVGGVLAGTPFEYSPGGVYSSNEWFHYASMVRLNGLTGLNAAISEYEPYTGQVFASPVANAQQASNELNSFFWLTNSLRGHIQRQYFQQYDFGLGVGYTVNAAPGSVLDQLLLHLEVSYTPDRTYTAPSLTKNFLRSNDVIGALVMEKYYRFSSSFPATYFVFQYMHRTKDDLFGRSLSGYGGTDAVYAADGQTLLNDPVAHGVAGGANYFVVAFQQPFPQDIVRVGFALLYDIRGSILVQPGFRWHINNHYELDAFYTYINARLGSNPNRTLLGGFQYANEASIRFSYQFSL